MREDGDEVRDGRREAGGATHPAHRASHLGYFDEIEYLTSTPSMKSAVITWSPRE
jgi:hypothetical protein